MNHFLNINNRQQIKSLLLSLKADAVPLWGKMQAQQMIEHLVDQVQYTNGTKVPTCDVPQEEAHKRKQRAIYTDAEIPKNVVLGALPEYLEYESMEVAINQLMAELEEFDQYFKEPDRTVLHGGFGPMNYHEWQIWHGKHFTHHFKQFGLF